MFKRKLNRIETIALSVAVIAMMVGISLNTPFIAGTAGTAVPLVFVISTIGVLCIAQAFVRLAGKVGHAGSVYGLIYYAQGRNYGFMAGWALLLTYAVFVTAALCGFGLFASGLLDPIAKIPWHDICAIRSRFSVNIAVRRPMRAAAAAASQPACPAPTTRTSNCSLNVTDSSLSESAPGRSKSSVELAQMVIEVLVHQLRPFHRFQRAEEGMRMRRTARLAGSYEAVEHAQQMHTRHGKICLSINHKQRCCRRVPPHRLAILHRHRFDNRAQ